MSPLIISCLLLRFNRNNETKQRTNDFKILKMMISNANMTSTQQEAVIKEEHHDDISLYHLKIQVTYPQSLQVYFLFLVCRGNGFLNNFSIIT